jgi:hypothetical protein
MNPTKTHYVIGLLAGLSAAALFLSSKLPGNSGIYFGAIGLGCTTVAGFFTSSALPIVNETAVIKAAAEQVLK